MGNAEYMGVEINIMLALRFARQTRRCFATGQTDAVQEVFLKEIKAVTARLQAAKAADQTVTPAVKEAMNAEVTTVKSRTGLGGIGEVGLADTIKMTQL